MCTLNTEDRERIMGYPQAWAIWYTTKGKDEESSRSGTIGNGIHLPSVALLLIVAFNLPTGGTAWASEHFDDEKTSKADESWMGPVCNRLRVRARL